MVPKKRCRVKVKKSTISQKRAPPEHPLMIPEVVGNVLGHLEEPKHLFNARLVNIMWNQETLNTFLEKGIPMVRLVLDVNRFVEGTRYLQQEKKQGPKLLFDIANVFGTQEGGKVVSFGLEVEPLHLKSIKYTKGLMNLIQEHGSSLTELNICMVPAKTKRFLPTSTNLPVCRVLSILIVRRFESHTNGKLFLKRLITACPKLEELKLRNRPSRLMVYASLHFDLPPNLTVLELNVILDSKSLQAISKSPLPHLKLLSIFIPETGYETKDLLQLLQNVHHSLERLLFLGTDPSYPNKPTNLRFPSMTKLVVIEIASIYLQPDEQQQDLKQLLPKLCQLKLENINNGKVRRWNDAFQNNSIDVYHVSVSDEYGHLNRTPPSTLLRNIHQSFSNLTCLALVIIKAKLSCLSTLFTTMTRLETLKLIADCWETPTHWTAGLLGIAKQVAESLEETECDNIVGQNLPGITLMTGLKHIYFVRRRICRYEVPQPQNQLIQDVVVRQPFLKMPALTFLSFTGKFWISSEMEGVLKEEGRFIEYSNENLDELPW